MKSRVWIAVAALVVAAAAQLIAQPDPRQMAGIPRPVTDLPDGSISVRLIRGQMTNNIVGHPVDLVMGDRRQTVTSDDGGRAQFDKVPPGTAVRAESVVDGETLVSRDFTMPATGGVRLLLVATDKEAAAAAAQPAVPGIVVFGEESRIVIELAEDTLQVYYLLEIVNPGSAPVNPPSIFRLEMPAEAQGTSVLQGSTPGAMAQGTQVTVPGPFPPGRTLLQVGYLLPYFGERLSLSQTLPATLPRASLLVRKLGDMRIESPQITETREVSEDGFTYVMASGPAIAAGGAVTVNLSGLPHHSRVPRWTALTLAGLIIVGGVMIVMRRTSRLDGAAERRKQLAARREKLFADLIRLEEQAKDGRLDDQTFHTRRAGLLKQLERIYGELEGEGQGPRGDEGLAA